MKLTSIFSVLLFTLASTFLNAQKILYEFTSKAVNDEFNAFSIGDTLLLSYSEPQPNGVIKKTLWISEASILNTLVPVDVYTTVSKGNEVYLYYLDGKKKSKALKALVYNKTTQTQTETSGSIPIVGSLVGSYEDKNLFLVLIDKEALTLSVVEVDGMTIVNETKFAFPFKINGFNSSIPIDFFPNKSGINSFKGVSSVKIYKYDGVIYMSIDEVHGKTLVARFDLQTGGVTADVFNADNIERFTSYVVNDKLFRIYNGKLKFLTTVVDLKTKQIIASSEILPPATDFNVYFRYGSKNIISHKATFRQMLKISPVSWPSIFVTKEQDSYVIQWGSYYNRDQSVVYIPGPSLAGLISAVLGTAFYQMRERPGITRYFNYEWDQQNSFKIRDYSTGVLKEKIDKYEIETKTRVKYKSYVDYKNGVVAIYYQAKEHKISVVYFEK